MEVACHDLLPRCLCPTSGLEGQTSSIIRLAFRKISLNKYSWKASLVPALGPVPRERPVSRVGGGSPVQEPVS